MQYYTLTLDKLLLEKKIIDFINNIREYVKIIENCGDTNNNYYKNSVRILEETHLVLAKIYLDIFLIGKVDDELYEIDSEFENSIDKNNVKLIGMELILNLGNQIEYWGLDEDNQPFRESLLVDYLDLYVFLKKELIKIDVIKTNESIGNALWVLLNQSDEWSGKLIRIVHALHVKIL